MDSWTWRLSFLSFSDPCPPSRGKLISCAGESATNFVSLPSPEIPFDVVAASQEDPTEIAAHTTLRKSSEWEFEEEYRVASNLGDIRLIPFEASAIKEIRLGARIKTEFKEKVMEAVSRLPHRPILIQMGCDFDRFILTETVI